MITIYRTNNNIGYDRNKIISHIKQNLNKVKGEENDDPELRKEILNYYDSISNESIDTDELFYLYGIIKLIPSGEYIDITFPLNQIKKDIVAKVLIDYGYKPYLTIDYLNQGIGKYIPENNFLFRDVYDKPYYEAN